MKSADFVLLCLQISVMLALALGLGRLMRVMRQPTVVGEMLAGLILGPTLLGMLFPDAFAWLFRSSASANMVRDNSVKLGMLFFLFITGLEVNLDELRRLGRRAILIGLVGTLVPLGAGIALAYALPRDIWGAHVQGHFFPFALFMGMALANSANPVIARILMDLGLMREGIGVVIMTATIVDDLINWTLFALVLSSITPGGPTTSNPWLSLAMIALFFVVVLGFGRWIGPRAMRWMKPRVNWPSGFIAVTAIIILLAATASERLGIHAFLGAFLVGAALGGSAEERDEAHDVVSRFVCSFFVPLYFVSMGINVNFAVNLDWLLIASVLVVACASKIAGVVIGARLAGMPIGREACAIGFGLNARGATGIILAGVGLEQGVIDARIYVAMVIMCLVTSIMSGPMMMALLGRKLPARESPPATSAVT